jgi:4-amino-4-deoxy-L-arabinose transferase-like glycosyltransferase
MAMLKERRFILPIIFLLALSLRLGLNVVRQEKFFHEPFLLSGKHYVENISSDSALYDGIARAFMAGKGPGSIEESELREHFFLKFYPWTRHKNIGGGYYALNAAPPLYPIFLALCYYLGGLNTLSYFIPQIILGSLTCLLIYYLAEEIFDQKTAVLAGFMMALYPALIFWSYLIRVETLFIFLLCLGFLLMIKGNRSRSMFLICLSAIIFGLACLTRVTLIFFIPVLFIWEILYFSADKIKNLKTASVMMVLIALVLTPWCIRNFLVFNNFTPFSDEINIVILGAWTEDPIEIGYSYAMPYYKTYDSTVMRIIMYVKDHFSQYFTFVIKRLALFWYPCTEGMRPIAKIYKSLTWIIIFPSAFWGMFASVKRRTKSALLIVIFIFYYYLMHAASFVDGGLVYRYPIEPFLCIFAAYGYLSFFQNKNALCRS